MKKARKKFKELLKAKGITVYRIARLLNIDPPIAYYWLLEKSVPCIKNLIRLKEILGVSGNEILEIFMEKATNDEA